MHLGDFLKKSAFQHIFGHISGTTDPIGLNFLGEGAFDHRLPHTKFQPSRLKDWEDIGGAVGLHKLQLECTAQYTFMGWRLVKQW